MKVKVKEERPNPTKSMVDTLVLGYAIFAPAVSDSADSRAQNMREDSRALLNQLQIIHISAITWIELRRMRRLHPNDQALLAEYKRRFYIHPVDPAIAESSADLLENFVKTPGVCPRCFSFKGSDPCPKCKAMRSRTSRINDAIVVATANEVTQVEALYTYDGGMLVMAKDVSGCKVMRPPHRDGPLFAHGEEKTNADSVLSLSSSSPVKAADSDE